MFLCTAVAYIKVMAIYTCGISEFSVSIFCLCLSHEGSDEDWCCSSAGEAAGVGSGGRADTSGGHSPGVCLRGTYIRQTMVGSSVHYSQISGVVLISPQLM